jgi:hypothetical protein
MSFPRRRESIQARRVDPMTAQAIGLGIGREKYPSPERARLEPPECSAALSGLRIMNGFVTQGCALGYHDAATLWLKITRHHVLSRHSRAGGNPSLLSQRGYIS